MNKHYCLTVLIALFFSINLSGQFNIAWQQTYGFFNKFESAEAVHAFADGSAIVAIARNTNDSGPLGNTRAEVFKYDATGNTVWQTTLGGPSNDNLFDMIVDSNGNILTVGQNSRPTVPDTRTDLWVVKMNSSGSVLWEKRIGGSSFDSGRSIIATSDGGYLVVGSTESDDGIITNRFNRPTGWIVKLDANGNVQWNKTYGGFGVYSILSQAAETSQGDFIIGAAAFGFGEDVPATNGDYDFWIFKINSTGDLIWSKNHGGFGPEFVSDLNLLADGSMIISGTSNSHATGDVSRASAANTNFWIVKLDASGDLVWEKSIGGDFFERNSFTKVAPSGEIYLAGSTNSNNLDFPPGYGDNDFWVMRLDASGNILDKQNFGGSDSETITGLDLIGDRLLVVGSTRSTDGDVIGASGGTGADAWTLSLTTQFSPPPPNVCNPDVTPPVWSNCPADISVSNGSPTQVNWTPPTAADVCSFASFTSNFAPSYTFPLGTTRVIYTSSDQSNNTSTCEFNVTVQSQTGGNVDLELSVVQNDPNPRQWGFYTLTATVNNTGSQAANNVEIEWLSPNGVTYQGGNEFTASQGNFKYYSDQIWSVGTIPAGGSATLEVSYFLLVPTAPVSYVQVSSMSGTDADSTPGNGTCCTPNEDDEASTDSSNPPVNPPLVCNGNLITNGDFENGLTGWTGKGFFHRTDPSDANSGNGSMRVCDPTNVNSTPPDGSFFMEQSFPVTPNVGYQATFYSQNNGGGGSASLIFYSSDGSFIAINNASNSVNLSTGVFPYQSYSISAIAPLGAVEGRIVFRGHPFTLSDCIEVDDICVQTMLGLPLPDLEITDVQIPASIEAGSIFNAQVTVRNNGDIDFNQPTLIQALVSFGIVEIKSTPTLNLAPGASQTFTLPFNMLGFNQTRQETMKFNIDILDTTDESNETNNDYDVDFQLTVPNTGSGIDLELSLTQNNANPRQWSAYTVTATINNTGSQAANNVEVEWLSPNGVTYQGGNEFTASQGNFKYYSDQIWSVGTIPAGGSATLEVSYFLLQPNAPAAYAQVSSMTGTDADSTPGNGTCCTSSEDDEASTNGSNPPPPSGQADLTLSNLSLGATTVAPGDILNYNFNLQNIGNDIAAGNYQIKAYISTDQTLSANDIQDGIVPTGNTAAGANISVPGASTIPANLPQGDYYLILIADDGNAIAESNESNNTIVSTNTFTVQGTTPPTGNSADLSMSIVTTTDIPQWANWSVTYVITNGSATTATGIKANIAKPDQVVYTGGNEFNTAQGTFDLYGTETWDVGSIGPGDQAVFTANYFRVSANPLTLYGQVTASDQSDPDSTPNNGSCCVANEDDEAARSLLAAFSGVNNRSTAFESNDNEITFLQSVFPNPTSDQMTVRMIAKAASETEIQVIDNFGRILITENWQLEQGVNQKTIDMSLYPAGLYQVIAQPFHPYLRKARVMKVRN